MKSYFNSCFLLGIIVFASSCNYTPANERDTPTQGKENICVDESYYILMSTQVFTFMSKYADATINERYIPEEEAIKALIDDSVDLAVISRELNPNEIAIFKARNIQPRMVEIAKDAVSFIVNKNNPDSVFTKKQIDQILSGKAKNWKDLNNNGSLNSSLVVVLDNQRSSNARYLKDSFIHSNTFPSNITVAGNNMAVFDYVAKYPGAIGIISNGWISDRDDSSCNTLLNKISLVAVKKDETSEAFCHYKDISVVMSIHIPENSI